MAPPLLTLDGIVLSFGGTPLLDGAELSVSAGDRIALVGRNGSGKSTLLKIAAGMIEPQDGKVFRHPSATVRYLPQAPDMDGFATAKRIPFATGEKPAESHDGWCGPAQARDEPATNVTTAPSVPHYREGRDDTPA